MAYVTLYYTYYIIHSGSCVCGTLDQFCYADHTTGISLATYRYVVVSSF